MRIVLFLLGLALTGCATQNTIGTAPVEIDHVRQADIVIKAPCISSADIPEPPKKVDATTLKAMTQSGAVQAAFDNASDWVLYAKKLHAMLKACAQ